VETADHGKEAVEQLRNTRYDLVLMDIQMPEMNGYEATRQIRSEDLNGRRRIPIMAMTAHASIQERDRCMSLGMDDYISKPFDPEQLREQINQLLMAAKLKGQEAKRQNAPSLQDTVHENNIPDLGMQLDSSGISGKTLVGKQGSESDRNSLPVSTEKIDLSYIRQLSAGSNEFIIEMIELFLSRTQEALEALQQETAKNNWEEVRQIAHRIKPTFRYVGTSGIQHALAEMERITSGIPENPASVQQLLDEIKSNTQHVFIQLKSELKTIR
jgi:CheY-like chemotaxis protein